MILTAPKSRRQKSARDIEEELDRITSLIVRARTPYCVLCASILRLECGHYFPRFFRPVRWEFLNLATLCHRCNQIHEFNPKPYRDWLLEQLGQAGFDELDRMAHSNRVFRYSELLDLLAERKQVYEQERRAA